MKKSENILVVAAHPDDEVLGCGGTIARHSQNGDKVKILIVAEGATSRLDKRSRVECSEALSKLTLATQKASKILGASAFEILNLPDNRLDSLERLDLIKIIESHIDEWQPSIIYTHHSGDVNIDHRLLHEAVITASRPQPNQPVKTLLSFEIPSSTEWQPPGSAPSFNPNWFVNISSQWLLKKSALNEYNSEMREWPHPRSIEACEHLCRWRGAQVGVEAAEAFILLRNLQ